MRILVISDVHANAEAFKAVLRATEGERDAVACLGDLVGYGPDPDECVALAEAYCDVALAGNHDLAASGRLDVSGFSERARTALDWTRSRLSPKSLAMLSRLEPTARYRGLALSHGSPADPVWGYVLSAADAFEAFGAFGGGACLIGHTHVPLAFLQGPDGRLDVAYGEGGTSVDLDRGRWLLNPGSVGFPRDAADAHSAASASEASARYALLDEASRAWTFRRAAYDMRGTAERMRGLGLW